jgi:hypothetical protein
MSLTRKRRTVMPRRRVEGERDVYSMRSEDDLEGKFVVASLDGYGLDFDPEEGFTLKKVINEAFDIFMMLEGATDLVVWKDDRIIAVVCRKKNGLPEVATLYAE